MSNYVYPTLPGLAYAQVRQPEWNTNIHKAVSGKEFRSAWMSAPLYTYRLQYEFLRDAVAFTELQTLVAFFNSMHGSFDSFLYSDHDDNSVTAQNFGTGNGTQTAFQLMRSFGGNIEVVGNLNGAPSIYKKNWQGRNILSASVRTNVAKYSNSLSNSVYSSIYLTVIYNAGAAPDGTITATSLIENTALGQRTIGTNLNAQITGTQTVSIFAKLLSGTRLIQIRTYAMGGGVCWLSFDLVTGTVKSGGGAFTNALIIAVGGGWFRISVSYTGAALILGWGIGFDNTTTGAELPSYTGDGVSGFLVWGLQIEAGLSMTSYIPTTTVSVTVPADYSISAIGVVTFTTAPETGAEVEWTGSYYYRCRFLQDALEVNKFMSGLWEAKKVEFIGSLSPNRI